MPVIHLLKGGAALLAGRKSSYSAITAHRPPAQAADAGLSLSVLARLSIPRPDSEQIPVVLPLKPTQPLSDPVPTSTSTAGTQPWLARLPPGWWQWAPESLCHSRPSASQALSSVIILNTDHSREQMAPCSLLSSQRPENHLKSLVGWTCSLSGLILCSHQGVPGLQPPQPLASLPLGLCTFCLRGSSHLLPVLTARSDAALLGRPVTSLHFHGCIRHLELFDPCLFACLLSVSPWKESSARSYLLQFCSLPSPHC